jgi:hypothetical protein
MDIEKLFRALSDAAARERSNYHVTPEFVANWTSDDEDQPVKLASGHFPSNPHSYRGYYSDLALEATHEPLTLRQFRSMIASTIGQTYEGYKGGDFAMSESTPIWIADYGMTGDALVDMRQEDGYVLLVAKRVD